MRIAASWVAVATALSLVTTAAFAGGYEAARFTAMDNTVIRMYFAAKPVVWTGVPAAVARDFARGKTLPPQAVKHALPPQLLAKLPARAGFEYVRVGADVALVDKSTRIVADVIENALD